MYYEFPQVTKIVDMLRFIQNSSDGIFFNMILISIFVISYVSLSGYPLKKSLLPSLYITLISGMFFVWLKLIPEWVGASLVIVVALSTLYIYWKGSEKM